MGYTPRGIVTDLDGDGKIDLAAANMFINRVSVSRNISTIGNFNFETLQTFEGSGTPRRITTGDLDGDGRPDLATVNSEGNAFSVFRNTSSVGSISFDNELLFTTGLNPFGIAIGDLDNDGKADIVTGNYDGNSISIHKNTTLSNNISFDSPIDLAAGPSCIDVAIGDIDGDGKPDIVVNNVANNTVSIFRNTSGSGNISFASKIDYSTGSYPQKSLLADVNGDSKIELIVCNLIGYSISIYKNLSVPGNISLASSIDYGSAAYPYDVAAGDLNGDSKPDLATSNGVSNTLALFKNNSLAGSISFDPKVDYSPDQNPQSVAIADMDGDSKLDVVVFNLNSETASLFRNTHQPQFETPTLQCPSNVSFCYNGSENYTLPPLTINDPCSIVQTINYTITGATARNGNGYDASGHFNVGNNTIIWTVTDINNQSYTCQTSVTISNSSFSVAIPDVYAVNPGGNANTIYIGYGSSSLTLSAVVSGGTTPYTYIWSTGSNQTSILTNPANIGTYNYSVIVTDNNGCQATTNKTVTVTDIRCGNQLQKVLVCKPGKKGPTTVCVGFGEANGYLANGGYLGPCIESLQLTQVNTSNLLQETNTKFNARVTSNPSSSQFTFIIQSESTKPLFIKVYNSIGRLVEKKIISVETFNLGDKYQSGVYYVYIEQGNGRITLPIVKL